MLPAGHSYTDRITFRDADNELYTPTSVVLTVRQPNGTLVNPTPVLVSLGVYDGTFTLLRGITRWEWDGITGTTHDKTTGYECAAEGVTV